MAPQQLETGHWKGSPCSTYNNISDITTTSEVDYRILFEVHILRAPFTNRKGPSLQCCTAPKSNCSWSQNSNRFRLFPWNGLPLGKMTGLICNSQPRNNINICHNYHHEITVLSEMGKFRWLHTITIAIIIPKLVSLLHIQYNWTNISTFFWADSTLHWAPVAVRSLPESGSAQAPAIWESLAYHQHGFSPNQTWTLQKMQVEDDFGIPNYGSFFGLYHQ